MKIGIVLGNWINDDNSISDLLKKRIRMAKELLDEGLVDKLILSGGWANKKANITEALAMYNNLITLGCDKDKLILEDKSTTTTENAMFSIPKALALHATTIIIVSTFEHFTIYNYNVIKIFENALHEFNENTNVRLMIYTDTRSKKDE